MILEEMYEQLPGLNLTVSMNEMSRIKTKSSGMCNRHAEMLEQSGSVVRICKMHASPRRNATMWEVCVAVLNGVSTLGSSSVNGRGFALRRTLF